MLSLFLKGRRSRTYFCVAAAAVAAAAAAADDAIAHSFNTRRGAIGKFPQYGDFQIPIRVWRLTVCMTF